MKNIWLNKVSNEAGASLIEYTVLFVFLVIAAIASLGELGFQANAKFCEASLRHNRGDIDQDGDVDDHDMNAFIGATAFNDHAGKEYDYDCNGLTEGPPEGSYTDDGSQPPPSGDFRLMSEWTIFSGEDTGTGDDPSR